jgi:hypothetical protein
VLSRNAITGDLTHVADLGLPAFFFFSAVSPDSAYVYAFSPLGVTGYLRDATTGALTPLPPAVDSVTLEATVEAASATALDAGDSVHLAPDGTRLYVGDSSDMTVSMLARNSETGLTTPIEVLGDSLGGVYNLDQPADVAASADGRHFYVATSGSGTIGVFDTAPAIRAFDVDAATLKTAETPAVFAAVAGERSAVITPEQNVGADLNGDGDMEDDVAQLFDVAGAADEVVSLGYAARVVAMSEDLLAMVVPEARQDEDLNEDGDFEDDVLVVFEIGAAFAPVNTGLIANQVAVVGTTVVLISAEPGVAERRLRVYARGCVSMRMLPTRWERSSSSTREQLISC